MTTLPTRSQATIVATISAGAQGRAKTLLDFSVGSVLRAVAEAVGGICLWLQAMILQVMLYTRAATCVGPDLDSWVGQFNLINRLGAQAASGLVTFARLTAGPNPVLIPVGTRVQTGASGIAFAVYADTTNAAYSATANGYTMAAGVASVQCPVAAVIAGAAGNITSGAINQLASSVPGGGVDTVTNIGAFINGVDAESDQTFLARFQLKINSLSEGTVAAIAGAVQTVQVGLQYTISENSDYYGVVTPGMFSVVVDDGTGAISNALVLSCNAAVNLVRSASVRYTVNAATLGPVNVSMNITTATGYTHATVAAQVQSTVSNNINAVGLGNPIGYFNIAAWALSVAGCAMVENVLLNGAAVDLPATPHITYKAATITVA